MSVLMVYPMILLMCSVHFPPLGYCQKTACFQSSVVGSSTSGRRLEPSVQSRLLFDISGQRSRAGKPAASTRVGKMSTNSTRAGVLRPASVAPGRLSSRGAWVAT